jgi:adenosylcobinamide-phosphate synthase
MHPSHLLIAFLLDAVLGDPKWLPHPVKAIGFLISSMETVTRRFTGNGYVSGILTVTVTVGVSWFTVWVSLRACAHASPLLEAILDITWLYLGLAARGLADAGMKVYHALKNGDLSKARLFVGEIVGRDTDRLNEKGISQATIESVAENTVDGILSPLFFALLGGAPLLWAFKAISTCDSMIGYKTERYLRFGALGARLDDVANFIPARLCLLLFPAAALLCRASPGPSWQVARRDRKNHASPNAGIPEAAMAGALKVRLGGPAWYGGEKENKPFFGGEFPAPTQVHIIRSVIIMWILSVLFLFFGLAFRFIPGVWHG